MSHSQILTVNDRIHTQVITTTKLFCSLSHMPSILHLTSVQLEPLPSYYSAFWNNFFLFLSKDPFYPYMMCERTSFREDIRRYECYFKAFIVKFWIFFSPFSFSLIPFITSQTGCLSSWMVSSWSSADVNCLKGGVNLITCGIVNVTREALSLPNML